MTTLRVIFSLLFILIIGNLLGQGCQSYIVLDSQEKVDDFPIDYPCTILESNLIIGGFNANITSLDSLYQIIEIKGTLDLLNNENLESFHGLNNLTKIGRSLIVRYNNSITDLSGLENLESIGMDLIINNNNLLNSLSTLSNLNAIGQYLYIASNPTLENLDGLENVSSDISDLKIENNLDLKNVDALSNIKYIENAFEITQNLNLKSCCGLAPLFSKVGGKMNVAYNDIGCNSLPEVSSLCIDPSEICDLGFISLNTQEEVDQFRINYGCQEILGLFINQKSNSSVVNLDSLDDIKIVLKDLKIGNEPSPIESIEGLSNLEKVGGSFTINRTYQLSALSGLEKLTYVGEDLGFYDNDSAPITGLQDFRSIENLKYIGGDLRISGEDNIINFKGFDGLEYIGGNFRINNCFDLQNLQGLEQLDTIGGSLSIYSYNNNDFESLNGLQSLKYIGQDFYLDGLPNFNSFGGIENLTFVGQSIYFSVMRQVKDMDPLSNLKYVGLNVSFNNMDELISIEGIQNIAPCPLFNLIIGLCPKLNECSIKNVCYLLENSNSVLLDQNGPNCNDVATVLSNCSVEFLDDYDQDGFGVAVDCDDCNTNINPGISEIPNNEVDEDCDGIATVIDDDNDGYNSDQDCDDQNVLVNPNQIEIPYNGLDDDCDEATLDDDLDGDGYAMGEDCDDQDAAINPDAMEIIDNGIDENCDGDIDEVVSTNDKYKTDLLIYPNPTSGSFKVYGIPNTNFEITIYDYMGNELLVQYNDPNLNLDNYTKGIYIILVSNQDNHRKLISRIMIVD